MPFVVDGRSPTFAVARGACSYQCLKQRQWSHRDNRTNCIRDPAAAHFCTCCVPCTAPLQRQRVPFFFAWPWPWPWPGRGRGRGHGRGRPGGWDSRLAGWPAGRGRWSGVSLVAGCPHVRVAVAGGRAVAGWPGGWVAGWPRPWRLFAIRLHTKQLVFSCISWNLPRHISANYTRRPRAKQQACAGKAEQVA